MTQSRNCNNPVTIALIAVGSNLPSQAGSARANVENAFELLGRTNGVSHLKLSRLFQTPAYPPGSGPDFVNAAIVCETTLCPQSLLAALHDVEAQLGRVRDKRWDARIIDLDLLAFGAVVTPDLGTFEQWRDLPLDQQRVAAPGQLILPHPRLQDRGFVLIPLRDVAADWRHPVSGQNVVQMCDALSPAAVEGIKPLAGRLSGCVGALDK